MPKSPSKSGLSWALTILAAVLAVGRANAASNDAERVFLRTDCTDWGNDCFTTLAALGTWIWQTRQPDAASPLLVDVGPGSFSGGINCPAGGGWVAFRGAGRDHTRIVGVPFFGVTIPVSSSGCQRLAFQDLTIDATATNRGHAVLWDGGGSSTWTDVNLEASGSAWLDSCSGVPGDGPIGDHDMRGGRIISDTIGLFSACGRHRLQGTDVLVTPGDANSPTAAGFPAGSGFVGVWATFRAAIEIHGSTVRVNTSQRSVSGEDLYGLRVGAAFGSLPAGHGSIRMRGGISNTDSTLCPTTPCPDDVSATSVQVDTGTGGTARASLPGMAFIVKAGSQAVATRVGGDATAVESPFVWQALRDPPVPDLVSADGQDAFVDIDCDGTGDCDMAGTEPHLMLYRAACGASNPWWDSATGACRQ